MTILKMTGEKNLHAQVKTISFTYLMKSVNSFGGMSLLFVISPCDIFGIYGPHFQILKFP